MSQCHVCTHHARAQIELGVANKVSLRTLSQRYEVSKASIHRHGKNHMSDALKARLFLRPKETDIDLEQLRITESEGLLQNLVAQRGRLYALADKAGELGDISGETKVHGQLSRNLELTGKLLGDLNTGTHNVTNNILVAPQYHEMRTALIQALKPFPEARKAVTAALQRMEAIEPPAIEHVRG